MAIFLPKHFLFLGYVVDGLVKFFAQRLLLRLILQLLRVLERRNLPLRPWFLHLPTVPRFRLRWTLGGRLVINRVILNIYDFPGTSWRDDFVGTQALSRRLSIYHQLYEIFLGLFLQDLNMRQSFFDSFFHQLQYFPTLIVQAGPDFCLLELWQVLRGYSIVRWLKCEFVTRRIRMLINSVLNIREPV